MRSCLHPEVPCGWRSRGLLVGSPVYGSLRFAHSLWIDLERGSGWLRQLRTQPLSAHNAAKLLTSVVAARSMIVLVRGTTVLGGSWIRVEILPRTLPRREARYRRRRGEPAEKRRHRLAEVG
ncbi:MAG: hypothetical protein ACRDYX_20095 [Egibacteraceae bacterium]